MGKPTATLPKLSAAAKKKILKAVRDGTPKKFAFRLGGASVRSVYRYVAAGKKAGKGEAWHFWHALEEARCQGVAAQVALVMAAARKGSWKAAAYLLERLYPADFGPDRDKLRELERKLEAVLKAMGGGEGLGHAPPPPPGGPLPGTSPPGAPGAVQPGLAPPVPPAPLPDAGGGRAEPPAPGAG